MRTLTAYKLPHESATTLDSILIPADSTGAEVYRPTLNELLLFKNKRKKRPCTIYLDIYPIKGDLRTLTVQLGASSYTWCGPFPVAQLIQVHYHKRQHRDIYLALVDTT
jgi:hypothetical protein